MGKILILVAMGFVSVSLSNTIRPEGIVVHHTALTKEDLAQFPGPITVSSIDSLHEKRGFQAFYWGKVYHIGYHYLILADGTVQNGRPERCVGAHTRGHNNLIGICLVGDFSSHENPDPQMGNTEPTDAQIRSLNSLIKDITRRYGISCDQIYRHEDLNPKTECPGDRFPWEDVRTRIGCGVTK